MLTHARLKDVLAYDPSTGQFTALVSRGKTVKAGKVVGYVNNRGYRMIAIDKKLHQAHRLAWFYVNGDWPTQQIDHINGDPLDNRIANLRDVSPSINGQNKRNAQRNSRVQFLGVTLHKCGRFQALIGVGGGKNKYLGLYGTAEEAHAAYMAAKRLLHQGSVSI